MIYQENNPRHWIGHYPSTDKSIAMQRTHDGKWEGRWIRPCTPKTRRCDSPWTMPNKKRSHCWGGIFGSKSKDTFRGFFTNCNSNKIYGKVWTATKSLD